MTMTIDATDEILSVLEAAHNAHCHPNTIYRALYAGKLKGKRVGLSIGRGGKNWEIKRSDLKAWLKALGVE